jgi:hypothetical protein
MINHVYLDSTNEVAQKAFYDYRRQPLNRRNDTNCLVKSSVMVQNDDNQSLLI